MQIPEAIKNSTQVTSLKPLIKICLLQKKWIILSVLLFILSGIALTVNIALIGPLINYGINAGSDDSKYQIIYSLIPASGLTPFLFFSLLMVITSIITFGLLLLSGYVSTYTTAILVRDMNLMFFEKIQQSPYSFYVDNQQGNLTYAASVSIERLTDTIGYVLYFIQNALMCLFFLALMFVLSVNLCIAVIVIGIGYNLLFRRHVFQKVYDQGQEMVSQNKNKSVLYNEYISGVKTIKIFSINNYWRKKHNVIVDSIFESSFQTSWLQKIPSIFTNFLFFFIAGVGSILLYYLTNGNFISYLPIIGTVLFTVYRMLPSIQACQISVAIILQYLPNVKSVYEVIWEQPYKDPRKFGNKPFSFTHSISFNNVSFSYSDPDKKILNQISFDILNNKKTAIVGSSGGGKTTLVNLLTLLYDPCEGEILADGVEIHQFEKESYLRKIGYVGQETFIFNNTIRENIRFGMEPCTDEMIQRAAKLANAHEFITNTSDGYDTVIGDMGMKLSGGQRQRLAIARALLREPEILILDEATSSLDNIAEKEVINAIDNLSNSFTTLIIAHRLSTIIDSDIIYVMDHGMICESGTHEELIQKKGVYYRLYLTQS